MHWSIILEEVLREAKGSVASKDRHYTILKLRLDEEFTWLNDSYREHAHCISQRLPTFLL